MVVFVACIAAAQPALYVWQAGIIFLPSREVSRRPADLGWPYEEVWLDVGRHRTHAWFIPADGEAVGTVLFSHGNLGCMSDNLENAAVYREIALNVMLYDYGGYGMSTGKPSERRCYADARAAWDWLTRTRGIPSDRTVLVGRSLGSGPTCRLGTEVVPAAVVLESAFPSVAFFVKEEYPWFPTALLWHRFDNAAKIARITAPVLFVHGSEDRETPIEPVRDMYERAPEPKWFIELRGGHGSAYIVSREEYQDGLKTHLLPLVQDGEKR